MKICTIKHTTDESIDITSNGSYITEQFDNDIEENFDEEVYEEYFEDYEEDYEDEYVENFEEDYNEDYDEGIVDELDEEQTISFYEDKDDDYYNQPVAVFPSKQIKKQGIIKKHPAAAAALALTLFAAPIGVYGVSNVISGAAELDSVPEIANTIDYNAVSTASKYDTANNGSAITTSTTTTTIGETTEDNADEKAAEEKATDESAQPENGSTVASDGQNNESVPEETAAEPVETVEAIDEPVFVEENVSYTEPEPVYVEEPAYVEPVVEYVPTVVEAPAPAVEPTPVVTPEPAPAPAPEPQINNSISTTPHSMTADELSFSHAIFDEYNNWRAARGLPRVAWSEDCANMAYGSAKGCASQGQLIHRLGIPGQYQNSFSDILQFASWKMTPQEAITSWEQSDGHRKMMQCNTTSHAAVGAFNDNGEWYFAIVYDFVGTNYAGY